MSIISRITTWTIGQVLKAADLNGEFSNITNLLNNLDAATTSWTNVKTTTLTPTNVGPFTMTGALAMGTNKITGLGNGTTATDAGAFGQIKVLQLPVFASEVTGLSTASTSFVDGGATLTITPSTTTSKIIVVVQAPCISDTNNAVTILGISGTTNGDLFTTTTSPGRSAGTTTAIQNITLFALDAPGTVAAQTYKLRVAAGSNTVKVGSPAASGSRTQILALEVLA